MPEEHTVEPVEESSSAVVPVRRHREAPKASFWQRISLRSSKGGLGAATSADQVLARLDSLTEKLAESDQRIEQLDQRFSEVWEVEEQLSLLMEFQDILTDVRKQQSRLDERLQSLGRRLSLVTLFAVTAAVAGLAAVALQLL